MAKKTLETTGLAAVLAAELAEAGMANLFKKVLDRADMSVECLTTGLPRFDKILHEDKLGLVKGRVVEIYSKDAEVGKTSLALQIGVHWQKLGQRVAIVDIEDTVTEDYLVELGYVLEPTEESGMYPVYVAKGFNEETGEVLSAEEVTNAVTVISRIVDLVIIDSIGALAKRADLEKEVGEATMGGVAKIMWEWMRKNKSARATSIWINQALPQIGVFSPAGIKYKASGGNALEFGSSVKLELRLVEKLKANKDADPYGMVIDIQTTKNKVSPQYRHCQLVYLFGEGFSPIWDLFADALAKKVIEKKGSWLAFEEHKWQGEMNAYTAIKTNAELKGKIEQALLEALPKTE